MSNPDFALAESVSTTNATYFVLVYLLILIYCCFGLAVVCDVYFVPALQKLSYTYDLPPDIAGSTLMALGASVPELFASLIGVFVTEDDIGTGSIIGSSCFNLIAVPAACAFVASASFTRKLTLQPMPVIRNSAFYAITILVLLLIIKDNKVDIPEAVILLLFFVMYMAFMIFSVQKTKSTIASTCCSDSSASSSLTNSYISTDSAIAECNSNQKPRPNQQQQQPQARYGQFYFQPATKCGPASEQLDMATTKVVADERTPLVSSLNKTSNYHESQLRISIPPTNLLNDNCCEQQSIKSSFGANAGTCVTNKLNLDSVSLNLGIAIKNSTCLVRGFEFIGENGDNTINALDNADAVEDVKRLIKKQQQFDKQHQQQHEENWVSSNWILMPMLPLTLGMKVLTPCKFKNTCWTIWTFLVSVALIGGLTYISVWMVHLFGQTIGIPETVAGMTILSWGTGIPELIASIVLIKKTAQADMAICNTIGSNVIDVSFCLSLPWIVKCILNRAEGLKPEVAIQSAALPWTSFTLLLSVLLLILIFKLHDWKLSFSVGVWLTIVYITFVCVATYLESSFSKSGIDLMALL